MADNRRDSRNDRQDVEALERRAADDTGRDPTARRGEADAGKTISDADVGKDQILAKGPGDKPLMDKDEQKEGED
jgi:hypothetical protein